MVVRTTHFNGEKVMTIYEQKTDSLQCKMPAWYRTLTGILRFWNRSSYEGCSFIPGTKIVIEFLED